MYSTLDETPKPVTLLLKGDSGSGKTWKAAQFPRPVFFNFDNNLSGLRKLPAELRSSVRIIDPRRNDSGPVKEVDVWGNFVKQLEIVGSDKDVGTIVIDSLTTMAEVLMDKVLKSGAPETRVEIQHWGDSWRFFKWLGENMLCATDLDKHVIWIAHEQIKEFIDPKGVTIRPPKYFLSLGGKAKSDLDLFFTDVWRAYTKTSGQAPYGVDYWIRSLPTDYHTAKTSLIVPPDFLWDKEKESIMKQLEAGLPSVK